MPMGRPSRYEKKLVNEICTRLASGESLKKICSSKDMPAISTVFRWLSKREDFRDMYARAKEAQAECLADEIIDIADLANEKNAHAIKVRVDARKWVAAKLLPRKYGDFKRLEHGGPKGGPIPHEQVPPHKLSPEVQRLLDRIRGKR